MKTASNDTPERRCPLCGARMAADAPQGLCGACLLAGAATPTAGATTVGAGTQDIPSLERVAAAFPQFEIIELIGAGGMGVVYKARQPKLNRFVALKVLSDTLSASPAFTERFNREALLLARLSHPNIVTVYDYGQNGGFFYLLMEYVDGVNLRQAMKAGRFTPEQALALVPRVCEALQFAHDEGVLHRDIKPENLLLDRRGRVKIADFGIAKLVGGKDRPASLTASGATLGTPAYMAPEQLERPAEVDHRADIYSLGVVFYEMLTGELPLGRFAPPSKKTPLDERVDEVVLRALAKERELRQQSAGEMKTQVEAIGTLVLPSKPNAGETPPPRLSPAGAPPAPAGDFILLNPQLPRMARAITVYTVLVAPLLWLLSALLSPPEIRPAYETAFVVQQFTVFVSSWGRFFGVVSMLLGGFKLRGLRPDALRWIRQGIWLRLAMLAMRVIGLAWADALNRGVGTPNPTPWMIVSGILGFGTLAWEIACLIWMQRAAPVLHALLGLPAPRAAAPQASVAALWTALSLAVAVMVTGVILAAPQVAAWQLGQPFPLFRLGAPGSPGGLMIYGIILICIMVSAVKGCRAGWTALRAIRAAQAQLNGIKRAVFGAAAWPALLAMGAATSGGTIALLQSSFSGLATIALFGAISLVVGELVLGGTWRWAVGNKGSANPARRPRWVHRWVLCGQLAAVLTFVPIITLVLPELGGWSKTSLPTEDSTGRAGGTIRFSFTVPAGQVAVLELVTRSNGVTAAIPNLAAHVLAPADRGAAGLFLFRPDRRDESEGIRRHPWKIEIASRGGNASAGGLDLPESLVESVGGRAMKSRLAPEAQFMSWPVAEADLPANGLVGLRVRTHTHGIKPGMPGSAGAVGTGTNWVRATVARPAAQVN